MKISPKLFFSLCAATVLIAAAPLTACAQQAADDLSTQSQTWIKVTLRDGYEKPVQIHIFADHYRDPYYAHYALTKGNMDEGLTPLASHTKDKLSDGESTGWLNISETIYTNTGINHPNGGAMLQIFPDYGYGARANTFNGTVQFATGPSDDDVVKTFEIDYTPSTFNVVMPTNLDTKENIAKLKSDKDFANEYGAIADKYDWPTAGKKPVKFPFFVSAFLNPEKMDNAVINRELKTLSYFGFNGIGVDSGTYFDKFGYSYKSFNVGGWSSRGSYGSPDMEKIRQNADSVYAALIKVGIQAKDIAYATASDEPTGEKLSTIVNDQPSVHGLRAWIKSMNLTPLDLLLVDSWDNVKLVTDADKNTSPALYYYSEKYRTVALGNFLAIQKRQLQDRWKSTFPVVSNFSDGAIYGANFYRQGVDYFTLLHDTDQNAMWGEDWSNLAGTYQHATYNVELMRAAARKNGQTLGHYLIAYDGRKGFDIRLKAVSEVARGVKIFQSFVYGPVWANHAGSLWQESPQLWGDHAKAIREIGAVEDDLLPAMPQKASVAILYSSASDVWNQDNLAYGFERMNTWLALTHAQIPVDVVGEGDVADGELTGYKVCYLSDPNITRAAAAKLAAWVQAGGTLILTAGAGEKDEYNRPLDELNRLLPYQRNAVQTLQNYQSPGSYLPTLASKDTVAEGNARINVLSVKQTFANVKNQTVESTFADGSPAKIRSVSGKGFIVSAGYLPAIDYMRKALIAKNGVANSQQPSNDDNGIPGADDVRLSDPNEKSYNPWQYPADVRNSIIEPVKTANVEAPITCSVPLVDAVYMTGGKNLLIPLANYTLQPIKDMTLEIAVDKPVREVKSVYQGNIKFEKTGTNKIRIHLPLDCTDFVTVGY